MERYQEALAAAEQAAGVTAEQAAETVGLCRDPAVLAMYDKYRALAGKAALSYDDWIIVGVDRLCGGL